MRLGYCPAISVKMLQKATGALPWLHAILPMLKTKMTIATSGKITPMARVIKIDSENGSPARTAARGDRGNRSGGGVVSIVVDPLFPTKER